MSLLLRLGVYAAFVSLILAGGWVFALHLVYDGISPFEEMMTVQRRQEELSRRQEAVELRSLVRHRASQAVIAGEMDLETAAAVFRDSNAGLDWMPPMSREESYRQVICWVRSDLEDRNLVSDRAELLGRLERAYTHLFGHPPVLNVRADEVA